MSAIEIYVGNGKFANVVKSGNKLVTGGAAMSEIREINDKIKESKNYLQIKEAVESGNGDLRSLLRYDLPIYQVETVIYLNDIGFGKFTTEDLGEAGNSSKPQKIYSDLGFSGPDYKLSKEERKKQNEITGRYLAKETQMSRYPDASKLPEPPSVSEPPTVPEPPTETQPVTQEEEEEPVIEDPNKEVARDIKELVNDVKAGEISTASFKNSVQAEIALNRKKASQYELTLEIDKMNRETPRDEDEIKRMLSALDQINGEINDIGIIMENLKLKEEEELIKAGYIETAAEQEEEDAINEGLGILPPVSDPNEIDVSEDPSSDPLSDPNPDPDDIQVINMDAEESLDSPALNNTAILPTNPFKPKYHLDAIRRMYGNVDVPNWDPSITIANQKSDLNKEVINKYIDTLIKVYGDKLLIFERKSDGDIVEFNELTQLQSSLERGMQIGPRARQAIVNVADLVSFDNKLRERPSVAPPAPASDITPVSDVQAQLNQTENADQRTRNVFERDTNRFSRIVSNPYGIKTNVRLVHVGDYEY